MECIRDELNNAESLFKEIVHFYNFDKTDSITSQEFLQIWLSFSQAFSNYWDNVFINRKKFAAMQF